MKKTNMLQVPHTPPAPRHLTPESKKLWKKVVSTWEMDEAGFPILLIALESLDQARQAQILLERDGFVAKGRNNEDIVHPAHRVLKSARDTFLRSWKQLHLEEPGELPLRVGRPPGGRRQ